jgi:type II secretory pathway component PulJ
MDIFVDILLALTTILTSGILGQLIWNTRKNKEQMKQINELQKEILELRKDINLLTERILKLEKEIYHV